MNILSKIIVTDIHAPFTVISPKGRFMQMREREIYGLSLCAKGQITYTQNGQTFISTPQSAILLPRGGNYTLRGDADGAFPVINFQTLHPLNDTITVFPLQSPQTCLRLFEELYRANAKGDALSVYSIFYKLLSSIENRTPLRYTAPAIQYIENHYSDSDLSNQQLANLLGISEVYLRKLFQTEHHTTPKQYILHFRLQKAEHLLTDTTLSVSDIAEQCGFSSVYHFSRAFKAHTGLTPTDYIQQHKIYNL